MDLPALLLRPLRLEDEREARAAHAELARDGFSFLLDVRDGEPWAPYLARLERLREPGDRLPAGRVPATFLVAEAGGRLVGRVSIRHELDRELAEVGGHIGYGIRPADRGLGHARAALRQALPLARALGITQALVTCDEANGASATVIEACGGRFERLARTGPGVPAKRRYWIAT